MYYGREIIKIPDCGLENFVEFVKNVDLDKKEVIIEVIDGLIDED